MAVELPRLMAAEFSTDINEYVGDNAVTSVSQGTGTGAAIAADGSRNKFRLRNNGNIQFGIPASTELTLGFRARVAADPGSTQQFLIFLNATSQEIANLAWNTGSGTLSVRRGATVLATTSGAIGTSDVYVEVSINLAASGDYAVRFNGGTTDIAATAVDTENNAGPCTAVRIGWAAGGSIYLYLTDIYIRARTEGADDGYYNPIEIIPVFPDGDTAQADGVPSTGIDNYAMVDEADADGDTTYVEFAGAGEADMYTLEAFSSVHSGLVKCVAAWTIAERPTAGATNLFHNIKSGATTTPGNTRSLSDGAYKCQMTAWELNPTTASAWTASEIDSVEVGPETV